MKSSFRRWNSASVCGLLVAVCCCYNVVEFTAAAPVVAAVENAAVSAAAASAASSVVSDGSSNAVVVDAASPSARETASASDTSSSDSNSIADASIIPPVLNLDVAIVESADSTTEDEGTSAAVVVAAVPVAGESEDAANSAVAEVADVEDASEANVAGAKDVARVAAELASVPDEDSVESAVVEAARVEDTAEAEDVAPVAAELTPAMDEDGAESESESESNVVPEIEPTSSSASSTPAPACLAKLSVMNYNTRQLPKFLLFNDWDQDARLKRLPDTLRRPEYQADILILNELMTQAAYDKVKTLTDIYPHITTVVGKDCSGKDLTSISGPCNKIMPRSGVMALSKFPILETHGLIYKNAASGTWDAKCNKGAIYLKVNVDGLNVHVVGTHTQANEGDVDGGPTRLLQMKHLREWMESFAIPDDEPIILTGDINTERGSDEQRAIFEGNFVFNFVPQDFGTFSASTNWLTRADAYNDKIDLYKERHLDYVATWTNHLQPVRPAFMTIIPLKASEKWYWSYLEGYWALHEGMFYHDGYYADVSDHYPVIAHFEFPVSANCDDNDINDNNDIESNSLVHFMTMV